MPISKSRKDELVAEYVDLIKKSEALILTENRGLSVAEISEVRKRVREAKGSLHVTKNTLAAIALKQTGNPVPEELLHKTTVVGFTGASVAEVSKVLDLYAKENEKLVVKGAIVSGQVVGAKDVKALAELPTLPVLRAQLLGMLNTPAGALAGVVASGVRQLVNVTKAYSEKES